jgi:hypothetical protein
VLQVGIVGIGCAHDGHLLRCELNAGEDENRAPQYAADGAQGLKAWEKFRRRAALSGEPNWATKGLEAVSRKESPLAMTKSAKEEETVASEDSGRPEKKASAGKEKQPHDDAEFVPHFAHQQRSGNGQQKITHVEGRLHQPGLKTGDGERLHELADENVVQIAGNSPKKKQRGHQEERAQPGPSVSVAVAYLQLPFESVDRGTSIDACVLSWFQ